MTEAPEPAPRWGGSEMNDRLKEIEDNINHADIHTFSTKGWSTIHYVMFPVPDIRYLIDRVRTLEEENDKLQGRVRELDGCDELNESLHVEIERLDAESVRLRGALKFILLRAEKIRSVGAKWNILDSIINSASTALQEDES